MTSSPPSEQFIPALRLLRATWIRHVRGGGGAVGSLNICFFGTRFVEMASSGRFISIAGFELLAPTTAAPQQPGWPSTRPTRIDWWDRHGSRVIQNTQPAALVPRLMCNLVFCCRSAMTHAPSSIMSEARRVERPADKRQDVGLSCRQGASVPKVCSSDRILVRGRRQATLTAIWINSASTTERSF